MADQQSNICAPTKTCTKCGTSFPATEQYFYKQDGILRPDCKKCKQSLVNNRYARLKTKGAPPKSYAATKQCTQCKTTFPATVEYFYPNNGLNDGSLKAECKTCFQARARKGHHANRERNITRNRQYYRAHKHHIANGIKQWNAKHPEKVVGYSEAKRTRKLNVPINDFTPKQWLLLQELFEHRCAYCGKRCKGKLTQDHITPLSKGGNHTLSNIIPACRSCNSSKHTGPPLKPVQPLLL